MSDDYHIRSPEAANAERKIRDARTCGGDHPMDEYESQVIDAMSDADILRELARQIEQDKWYGT